MYSTCTSGCLKSNMISWNSFKHGGSGVQFKVSFEHSVSKGRKDLVVSPSDNYIETIQTECQNVTTVTQMLANRLQGSFIPQIKRIPPSKFLLICFGSNVNVVMQWYCSLRHLQWSSQNKMEEIPQSFYASILSSACAEDGTLRLWYCLILRKRIRNYYNHQNIFLFIVIL